MANINLLPPEFIPKGSFVNLANFARRASFAVLIVFLLFAGALASFFIINLIQIRNSEANQEKLKVEVKALEQTETALILIKDRIGKISTVLADRQNSIEKFTQLVERGIIPSVRDGTIDKDAVEVSIIVPDSTTLVSFMANTVSSDVYPNICLLSFTFNPALGYEVKLKFSDQ